VTGWQLFRFALGWIVSFTVLSTLPESQRKWGVPAALLLPLALGADLIFLTKIAPIAFIFLGAAYVLMLVGAFDRAKRISLFLASMCMVAASLTYVYQSFWPMVLLCAAALWAAFTAIDVLDLAWRIRAGLVLVLSVCAVLVLWPSVESMSGGRLKCPAYLKEHNKFRLVAGLDLRGGMRLVYTVDVEEAIKDKRDRYYEQMRTELARNFNFHSGDELPSEESLTKLREKVNLEAPRKPANVIRLEIKDAADADKVDERLLALFRGDLAYSQSADKRTWNFQVREQSESSIRERAVAQAKEIIHRRVDELGLREAAVSTRDEDVIIEVPGEDESSFANIRDIISQTARLEFKLLDDETDFIGDVAKKAAEGSLPEGLEFLGEVAPVGLDENGSEKRKEIKYAFLRKKPDEQMKDTLQRFKEWAATLPHPPDRELGFEIVRETNPDTLKETEIGWRTYLLKHRAEITGDQVADAQAMAEQAQGGGSSLGGWNVSIRFTDAGGNAFEKITGANVKKRFAILLDGRVESTPVILTRIAGGNARITMGSSDPEIQLRDSRKLELVLRSGALPAPISPSNEQRIGPSLGRDSIRLAATGAAMGGVLVLLFMLAYYHRGGLIANLAVLLNVLMQLMVLATFGASMTLPGIAGIALTMGMGVDGNVLINERIREELRAGKSPRAAVQLGFTRALSAIIDGHVTTLIAGVVLAQYGTGPIKGFAVTLIVGVMINIYTAVIVNRVFFDFWVRAFGRKTTLSLG
jgi:preprotein translocase subunit SecD